jgi:1,4-dihydroxy-2-naphthoate octaprenyltransferase
VGSPVWALAGVGRDSAGLKSFLMSSTIIMRYAFKSRSSFSVVLECPGLVLVGVLCSDDGEWSRFLLVGFVCLPFAIWYSLELVVIVVSG